MSHRFRYGWALAASVLLGVALPAFADPAPVLSADLQQMVNGLIKVDGHVEYQNLAFGFGVVPGTAAAYQGSGTDDGVLIPLGGDRTIGVNGGYDAAMLGSTRALMDSELSGIDPGAVQRAPFVLDSQPAEEAKWKDGDSVRRVVAEYRSTGQDDGINYTLSLHTDAAHQQADGEVFDAVVKSFKHNQITDD